MAGDQTSRGKNRKWRPPATAELAPETTETVSGASETASLLQVLREREEQLSFVMGAARLGTWDWDLRTGQLSWSPRCFELFDLPPDTAMSYERFLAAVHPEDRERIEAAVKASLSQHREYDVEMRAIWADGSVHWISSRGRAYYDMSEQPIRMVGATFDITNRKQAEQALRESEARFRSLFYNALDAILLTDGEGGITAANPSACALFGMTEQDICERGREGLVDPAESRLKDLVQQRKATGKFTGDLVHCRKDGTTFLAETTAISVPGEKSRVFVVLRDITERKLAEEKLRVSEEKFAKAFSGNAAAITVTKLSDGTFLEVNDTWTKLTGFTREEAVGVSPVALGVWTNPEMRSRLIAELREKGAMRGWQLEFRKKSGEVFFGELSSQFLTIGGEEVILSTLIDITKRKRAEEELRLTNERFQVALRNAHVFVFNQDLDLRYTWMYNPALGDDTSLIYGKRDRDLLERPEDAAVSEAVKRDVIENGVAQRVEVQIRWMGADRYFDMQVEPLRDPSGKIVGITGAAIDVTERKRAEAAMLRSEKLASVGRMAATVAHEINNPLEAVMNAIFLAQTEKSRELARKHLKTADEELRRVAHITRQSLGFYRDRTEPSCTSATLVLSSAVDLLKSKIRTKNAVIRKEWGEDVRVHAVANELRQVFGNLLANSLDAIAPGGVITLRAKRYTLPNGEPGVRIMISDDGAGIVPEARSRLFEPLFTTKHDVGTGLGLWVSKQIIEKHGGTVRVRSRCEGKFRGTTIMICLSECAD